MNTESIEFYAGLMSGTSLDGIDAALVSFEGATIKLVEHYYQPFSPQIRQNLQSICFANTVELAKVGQLDTQLGILFADCALNLFQKADIMPSAVKAIGSHGQTLYHDPYGNPPSTQAIGDPNSIAELTGVTTVADFRRRDLVVRGQGAPLAPAFHQVVFSNGMEDRAIVNIGGIANVTKLPKDEKQKIIGFDTGPGNALIDCWAKRHLSTAYDKNGDWAKSGQLNKALLETLLQDSYFTLPPPKSSGKEYFSSNWLNSRLSGFSRNIPSQDIQTTLCHLTALTITNALRTYCGNIDLIFVCGGGVHNTFLNDLIREYADCEVQSTGIEGVDPDWVEAMAFAWLAKQTLEGRPGNLPDVTGAERAVILGGIYPGRSRTICVN
ncbi:MAG: anhydro-N-acetylmuramic acid kinase [Methylococcales bacterium]